MRNPFGTTTQNIVLVSILTVLLGSGIATAEEGRVSVTITPNPCLIKESSRGQEASIEGFGRWLIPGKPDLPARIFSIAIPPGAQAVSVTLEAGEETELPGTYKIPPAPLPRVIGEEDPALYERDRKEYEANYDAVYGSDDPYPAGPGEFLRRAGYRKYNLVDVRITPLSYHPRSGKLVSRPKITIHVDYDLPHPLPAGMVIQDNMIRTERIARDIVHNYDQAQAWYADNGSSKAGGAYDLVIITLDSLVEAVKPLKEWEEVKGRNVKVVTVDWIEANYSGYDLAEKMRNFLREKYPSSAWGIQDVLIAGHFDDVPMRRCEQFVFGKPETDFYYAELSLPDSQSWDMDGDLLWGEDEDPIDFYAEVNTGRIPWSDEPTVDSICKKTVNFENCYDPAFKKNILLLGAFFWADTDCATLLEYKTDPVLHPWMKDWTRTRLYEKNGKVYSDYDCDLQLVRMNVVKAWSAGRFAVANVGAHGGYVSCHNTGYLFAPFITDLDCPELNDNFPAIMFADACSTSETDTDTCLGREMLRQGAVAYLGSTKPAYGVGGWSHPSHGSSQSLDYYYTTRVTSAENTVGESHQWALRKMYTLGLWYQVRFEAFEWSSLYGHPCVMLGTEAMLRFSFPEGLPAGTHPPGLETRLTVKIEDGIELFVPNTGQVHYRFDPNEPFTVVPLFPLGNDLYEAWLPQTKPGDKPEYYFSAQGDSGTYFSSPFFAPEKVHRFDLALQEIVMEDDFEHDFGWTVQNYKIIDGEWERGDPEGTYNGSNPVQPEDDHSPVGANCFVTGKGGGAPDDDDFDGFYTTLISPKLDLSDFDGIISFHYWFYHSESTQPHPLTVSVSNSDLWDHPVWQDHHGPLWNTVSFKPSDYLTLNDPIQVKIQVSDCTPDDIVEGLIDDFRVSRLVENPSLWADAYSVPEPTGGEVNFLLDAGSSHASRSYILLGSMSGTDPKTVLPGGTLTLPLEWDFFTNIILNNLNSAMFSDFLGTLDGQGRGTARMIIPAHPACGAGTTLYFAFALFKPCDFVSNGMTLEIQ